MSARAWVELLLLATIWGGSFLSIRVALDQVGVLTSVAFRVAGAAILLWGYVLARGLPVPRAPRVWLAFLGMGILNNAIPFSLITMGELHIPSGLASIMNASTAIFGVLVAALVFPDERLGLRRAAGVLIGFAGVVTAVGLGSLARLDPTSLAQIAVLGAALSYGCAAAFGRTFLKGLAPQVAAAGMVSGSTLILVPLAIGTEGVPSFVYHWQTWAALGYLAVLASAGAYLLYYRVLAMAGAGNVTLVTLLVAPIAIVLGRVVLGEVLPPHALAGFALLAAGLVIVDGRLIRRFRTSPLPPGENS